MAALLVFTSTGVALASDFGKCIKCHDSDEFTGMDAADIGAAVRDAGIAKHKELTGLTDEQVQAIAAELSGS